MATSKLDKVYGRRGGRLASWDDHPAVKHCEVCAQPMLAGQKGTRHYSCSPPLPCCGWPIDLVADPTNAKQHAADLERHAQAHADVAHAKSQAAGLAGRRHLVAVEADPVDGGDGG